MFYIEDFDIFFNEKTPKEFEKLDDAIKLITDTLLNNEKTCIILSESSSLFAKDFIGIEFLKDTPQKRLTAKLVTVNILHVVGDERLKSLGYLRIYKNEVQDCEVDHTLLNPNFYNMCNTIFASIISNELKDWK